MFSKNKTEKSNEEYSILRQVRDIYNMSNKLAVCPQLENPIYPNNNINKIDEVNTVIYRAKPNFTNFYIFNEKNLISNNTHYLYKNKVLDIEYFRKNKEVKFASNKILINLSKPNYSNDEVRLLTENENYVIYGLPMYKYYPEYGEVFNMTILFFSEDKNKLKYVNTAFHFVFKNNFDTGSFYGNPYFLKSLFEILKIGKSIEDAVDIFDKLSLFNEPVIF